MEANCANYSLEQIKRQLKRVDNNGVRKYNAQHCLREDWCNLDDGMLLEQRLYINVLYDLYGPLLTERQRKVYEMRYFSDWSLSEIAENLRITRQAVHILVNRTVERLLTLENGLGIAERLKRLENRIEELESRISEQDGE